MSRARFVAAAALLASLALSNAALAGPLAPPSGAVTSTGKTLTEIEPRIAINATNTPGDADATFRITQPGSYYLASNLVASAGKAAIQIEADNVTIDLNGFTMQGTPGTNAFIDTLDESRPVSNLTITNGTINGFGSVTNASNINSMTITNVRATTALNGVNLTGYLQVSTCSFTGPGSTSSGLGLYCSSGIVRDSTVYSFGTGIDANGLVQNVTVGSCMSGINMSGGKVIGCTVSTATGANSTGITLNIDGVAERNTLLYGTVGIRAIGARASIRDNAVSSPSTDAIRIENVDAIITGNTVSKAAQPGNVSGIRVLAGSNRATIDNNTIRGTDFGIIVNSTDCLIIRNAVGSLSSASNTRYQIEPGNRFGPLVKAATNTVYTSVGGNSSATVTGTLSGTDPFANLYW